MNRIIGPLLVDHGVEGGFVVIDCENPRVLAEFYRQLFGLSYRPGSEPPDAGEPDSQAADWLVLRSASGMGLAFQQVDSQPRSSWPEAGVPQMLHLDSSVTSLEELEDARDQAVALGASILSDRSHDVLEPLYVFADPAGHPFCIFNESV